MGQEKMVSVEKLLPGLGEKDGCRKKAITHLSRSRLDSEEGRINFQDMPATVWGELATRTQLGACGVYELELQRLSLDRRQPRPKVTALALPIHRSWSSLSSTHVHTEPDNFNFLCSKCLSITNQTRKPKARNMEYRVVPCITM